MYDALTGSPTTPKQDRLVKLLVFSIGSLHLALSVSTVKKVLNYSAVRGTGLSHFGITTIEDREITVIDLHRRLFKTPQAQVSGDKGYLILALNSDGEYFGIWVAVAPSLEDVPLSQLRILPESYRRSDTLSIASHVMALATKDSTLTVFLLDVDRLLD
ncbi:MAG: hypothetical protein N5P05_003490 [Chroococcopsis gigantea SAG 12.99]|jgi:chemotaxis signal transduction protein|nr:chemotaxis protein CheW [Chlorogloea purpurea SAG 13.99]MDV3001884.1 hypothetical protein [Chroococcopsis gigantea SAG 12.99]